jgi:DNA-binding transcriptional ArsR family regulator
MPADPLSATFAALADPTRRAILARLCAGPSPVNELAAPFRISLPAVSKHLKVLERAGLISRSQAAQTRPCRLEPEALQGAAAWLEQYRRLWEEGLERLDVYLRELQRAHPAPQQPAAARKQPAARKPRRSPTAPHRRKP